MTDHDIETRIVRQLIQMSLARGYIVSIWDGEDWCLIKSKNMDALYAAMMSTDSDVLILYRERPDGSDVLERIGSVVLVYGNGVDVVSDYTDREELENLVDDTLRHWS